MYKPARVLDGVVARNGTGAGAQESVSPQYVAGACRPYRIGIWKMLRATVVRENT